jgi:uncharacterized damage-inducible protein DinB
MNEALVDLYRHKSWATVSLIEFCEGVGDEVLDATTPGTYGTIRDTLRHLVGAEEGYFFRLTGKRFSEPMPEGPVPLPDLAERIRVLSPHWEALARDAFVAVRKVTTTDGWQLAGAVVMAQAIHHADDHRTHVMSVLSANGVEGPDLDLWSYAEATGIVQRVAPAGE